MKKKIRYAVVGLGHIAQVAVLPAFRHASKNSELVALVSSDGEKLKKLGRKYKVKQTYTYDNYDQLLNSGEIDAVYIALPNDMHKDYSIRAMNAGIHVLTEKPMAVTMEDCEAMITAARRNNVKLMVAYRLHFEQANLEAIKIGQGGKLGDLKIFNSVFTMNVSDPDNIRLQHDRGGGPLYDIGIYCINAARYLFRSEPVEVTAFASNSGDKRFIEVDEMVSAIMRFPDDRLASFTVSFGSADNAVYDLVGTKGSLRLEPAYEYAERLAYQLKIGDRIKTKKIPKRDQFGPELLYFSQCVLNNVEPEPSGAEGLADVKIIQAIHQSAHTLKPVTIKGFVPVKRPAPQQEIRRPGINKPETVNVEPPAGG